jgi:hypothetical protein
MRAEQTAQNAKNDARFERMLAAFMNHSTKEPQGEHNRSPTKARKRNTTRKEITPNQSHRRRREKQHPTSMDTDSTTETPVEEEKLNMELETSPLQNPKQYYNPRHEDTETAEGSKMAISEHSDSSNTETRYNPDNDIDSRNTEDQNTQMKIDWQGSGSGTGDENEWSENRQTIEGRTSPGSYTQEDHFGNNSDSTHFTSVKSSDASASFGTVDSDDPTHEKYENQQNDTPTTKDDSHHIESPPSVSRQLAAQKPENLDSTLNAKEKREKKLVKARARLEKSLQKAKSAEELTQRQTQDHIKQQASTGKEKDQSQKTPQRKNVSSEPEDPDQWSLVGSSKRKAKESLTKTHQLTLRKSPQARASKKHIVAARDSQAVGDAGLKN